MSTITTRSGKGSPLTNSEVDTNFTNLNTDKLENITGESIKNLSDVNSSMSPSAGDALVYDANAGWQSGTVSTGAVANAVAVTVANSKFVIDGTSQQALTLSPSVTYRFDQSDSSNANHPLKFSTTDNGTHNSGSEFTTGVTVSGTAGSTDAYVEIKLEQDAPSTLYYYCGNHSNMGGTVSSGGSTAISVQDEGSALSTAAETLNFTGAGVTASGTGAAKTINIPGATVTTNGSLDPVKQTEFTATANQTSFSVAYGVGNISVYHNGAKLAAADFTATNGTSVVLAAGAAVNDLVVVEEYGIPFASPYTASVYTASAGQTTLSVNYTVAKVAVYVNGVKLLIGATADVVASNGTSLTFNTALSAGGKIEVVEHGALVETTTTFTGLTDTPSALGTAGQVVQVNSGGNALEFADASGGVDNQGTLTKTFTQNEEATITLSNAVSPVPMVSVFKEIPQVGVSSKGNWDVTSTGANYDRFDEAPVSFSGATLTPSSASADGTFTLSSGAFASTDVGKTVVGNSGKAIIKATNGTYDLVTSFTNTNAIAAGSWALYGVVPKADGSGLTLSSYVPPAWDLGNAAYNNVNIDPASGVGNSINGIAVSTDGSKLYASSSSVIYQYSITGGDISTASYDSTSYSSSQQTSIKSISFKPDGTKMYVCGSSGSTIYQYTLSTAWDVSSASYDSKSATSSWGGLHGHCFNDDGSKLYLTRSANASNASVNSFSLTADWDISTASDDNVRIVTVPQGGNTAQGIAFNGDGSKLFVIGQSSSKDYLFQYNLTSAFNLSTASYSNVSFQIQDTNASINYNAVDLHFSSDGTAWYTSDNGQQPKLYQYSSGATASFPTGQYLPSVTNTDGRIDSTYWTDINSMTADEAVGDGTVNYAVSTDNRTTWLVNKGTAGVRKIAKNNSGTWQYNNDGGSQVSSYYDLANASYSTISPELSQNEGYMYMHFKPDGTKVWVGGQVQDTIFEYDLTTAWNLSSISYGRSYGFSTVTQGRAFFMKSDGSKAYISNVQSGVMYELSLTTDWNISTASHNSVTLSLGQTSHGFYFKSDGTKLYNINDNSEIKQFTLSPAWDLSQASLDSTVTVASNKSSDDIWFSHDGTKFFIVHNTSSRYVDAYSLSTAWDISSTITLITSYNLTNSNYGHTAVNFNSNGTKMFVINSENTVTSPGKRILEYDTSVTAIGYGTNETWVNATTNNELSALQQALSAQVVNRIGKAQLDAIPDANHFPTGDTFDLMIGLYRASTAGSLIPKSDGVTINYDAAAKIQQAINGTDYEADFPTSTKVRIKSLAAQNLKVRVI